MFINQGVYVIFKRCKKMNKIYRRGVYEYKKESSFSQIGEFVKNKIATSTNNNLSNVVFCAVGLIMYMI